MRAATWEQEMRAAIDGATEFHHMLAICERAMESLYQPLRDTQPNDVAVRAALIALAARKAGERR